MQLGAPWTARASESGSPESSLSPCSDLSVPSNPARSAQSLSSYNPFEDEDDTGSTVSEKEDIKAKKLVNKRFPLLPSSLALSLSFSVQARRPPGPQSSECTRPAGGGPALAFRYLREGVPANSPWLLFLPLTLVRAPHRKMGSPTVL